MHRWAFVVSLAAVLCGCQPPPPREPLDGHTLHLQLQQLASIAAEADLLAQQLQARHLNGSFAWVHQQSLGEEAIKTAGELARPAPPQLQQQQRTAEDLALRLRLALTGIAQAQYDPSALDGLRAGFADLRSQARRLGGDAP